MLFSNVTISVIVQSSDEKQAADEQIRSKLELNQDLRLWSCRVCAYSHSRKEVVTKHVDTKHMNMMYSCDYCQRLSPTQHALKEHLRTSHKDAVTNNCSYSTY